MTAVAGVQHVSAAAAGTRNFTRAAEQQTGTRKTEAAESATAASGAPGHSPGRTVILATVGAHLVSAAAAGTASAAAAGTGNSIKAAAKRTGTSLTRSGG